MIPRSIAPRADETWRTFIRNHRKAAWSCDFLAHHTTFFTVAYIFIIMEIASWRIVHIHVTSNPTLTWVKQPIREVTSDGVAPRFLVHDKRRHLRSVWQDSDLRGERSQAQLSLPSGPVARPCDGNRRAKRQLPKTAQGLAPAHSLHPGTQAVQDQ